MVATGRMVKPAARMAAERAMAGQVDQEAVAAVAVAVRAKTLPPSSGTVRSLVSRRRNFA